MASLCTEIRTRDLQNMKQEYSLQYHSILLYLVTLHLLTNIFFYNYHIFEYHYFGHTLYKKLREIMQLEFSSFICFKTLLPLVLLHGTAVSHC
jgi:hypothetical protein